MSELEETAKATQEVAKTTNTAIDATRDFGNYMSKFFTRPLEQVSELITDKLKYYTWSNKVNLMQKAQGKMDKLGFSVQHTIPLKLGIPLLEVASLEEDDRLQELWANLLVNSSTRFSLERSYISVLEQLSAVEAEILLKIYDDISDSIEDDDFRFIINPEDIFIDLSASNISKLNFNLALSNLKRLDCIGHVIHLSGEKYHTTLFGKFLFEAVKEPTK